MNPFDSELENELRELRPVAPPARLSTAIHGKLAAPPAPVWTPKVRAWLWASWSLTAAAMLVAVLAWLPANGGATTTSTLHAPPSSEEAANSERVVPVATTNVLTEASDEGLVLLADGRPARRLRLRYVDTVQLHDADAQADIAVSRPREEVRFVPVDFY